MCQGCKGETDWLFSLLHPLPHFTTYQAHKNCGNMNEIEAKVRYVKLARSLKTYGVSFFLVKVRS